MDDAMRIAFEMNASMWEAMRSALEEVTDEEARWRPLPEANSIAVIIRHLRIEAGWHVNSLQRGEPMPTIQVAPAQEEVDAITDDFADNWRSLQDSCERFLEILRDTNFATLHERTVGAYGAVSDSEQRAHLLGYHHAAHLAMHCGQIRTLRNLYRKTRGEPARFFPENPTYRQ